VGEVPLTSAFYGAVRAGVVPLSIVTCIPAHAFSDFGAADGAYTADLTLGSMPQLRTVGANAFHRFGGKLVIQAGDCAELTSIGPDAFTSLARGRDAVVAFEALPQIESIGAAAFRHFEGRSRCNHLKSKPS
jgi:hypothetical protein